MLAQSVAGSVDGQAVDAHRSHLGDGPVKRDGVGRRQRDGLREAVADSPQRPQAGRGLAEVLPDLPGEVDDRRFAVGAGDRYERPGLPTVEFGGQPCEAPTLLIILDEDRIAERIATPPTGPRQDRRSDTPPRPGVHPPPPT